MRQHESLNLPILDIAEGWSDSSTSTWLRYVTWELHYDVFFKLSPSSSILVLTILRPDYAARLLPSALFHYTASHLHLISNQRSPPPVNKTLLKYWPDYATRLQSCITMLSSNSVPAARFRVWCWPYINPTTLCDFFSISSLLFILWVIFISSNQLQHSPPTNLVSFPYIVASM